MKIFTFFYYFTFLFMKRECPNDDPYRKALKEINMPIAFFFGLIVLFILFYTDVWSFIVSIWDPDYVVGGKYNPLAPSSVLFMICWLFIGKFNKWYFNRSSVHKDLSDYYHPDKSSSETYDNLGRFLIIFFLIAWPITGLFCWLFGWGGIVPIVSIIIGIEVWIRYEFQWKAP